MLTPTFVSRGRRGICGTRLALVARLGAVSRPGAAPLCVAGVALGDIPTCEIACRKSLCVTGAIRLNDFRKITVQ